MVLYGKKCIILMCNNIYLKCGILFHSNWRQQSTLVLAEPVNLSIIKMSRFLYSTGRQVNLSSRSTLLQKNTVVALASVAQLVGASSYKPKRCRFGPQSGCMQESNNRCFFPSLSYPFSLKINKHVLR